jgi:hypothetical protein
LWIAIRREDEKMINGAKDRLSVKGIILFIARVIIQTAFSNPAKKY